MKSDSPLWRVLGDPAQEHEAAALDTIRKLLPDDGITRAWANVTFTDLNGGLNEVDLLLLVPGGLFVVELKGWNGEITGNQTTWRHNGRTHENPRILANKKAKRLASVLQDTAQRVSRGHGNVPRIPFISEAVVLHGRNAQVGLDTFGAEAVWALDGYAVRGLGPNRSFTDLLAADAGRRRISREQAMQLDRLMDAVGLMPRPKQRRIGEFILDSSAPIDEGPGWQDFLVKHPAVKVMQRLRLFPYPKGAAREAQELLDLRAKRELQLTAGIAHPGIIRPFNIIMSDEGPALVFDYDPNELSLSDFLAARADQLTFEDRERLVQDLAELVKFAHAQRLTHRALTPSSVRIKSSNDLAPIVCIRDWDLSRRPEDATTTFTDISRGVSDVFGQVHPDAVLYLAPETLRGDTAASARSLDVYGLGALATLILTGRPPVPNLAALQDLITSGAPGIDARALMPELSDEHALVLLEATSFQEVHRTIDVNQFLQDFADARAHARVESDPDQDRIAIDPLDAQVGDIIDERFTLVARRGSGTTGVALEVSDALRDGDHAILKVAKDDAAAARLAAEATVLGQLNHPRIVRLLEGPIEVGTRQALLMSDAGLETLADRIRLEGRGTIEQLERYADDLLSAVAYLEEVGTFHRDIKPANLAVRKDTSTKRPSLTLFDFSLAHEPLSNVRSGSRPYLDPYMDPRLNPSRSQYDSAAERFAVAATLFELATGEPVWWPEGSAPSSPTDAPVIQADMFDPEVADGLVSFFRKALAPQAAQRYPSLDAMREAWSAALTGAIEIFDSEPNDEKAAAATLATPLRDAGLSVRAISALRRVKAETVGELLGTPPWQINQVRGLGEQVRREIVGRMREWRQRLTAATTTQPDVSVEVAGRRAVEQYVGPISPKPGESPEDRFKRIRKSQTLRGVTRDMARWVQELGNVATLHELSRRLLREYGSTLKDPARSEAAVAVTRAVLELDNWSRDPLFVIQSTRDRSRTAIAYAPDDGSGLSLAVADMCIDTLLQMAAAVDSELTTQDVIPSARLRELLLGSTAPPLPVPEHRLAQLVVGMSLHGRLSAMGEAYRFDIAPERVVELALRGAPTRELAIQTIEQRVRARFPDAPALPTRPALDAPVKSAMPHLEWNDELGKYRTREIDTRSTSHTHASTAWGLAAADPTITARLRNSLRDSGALTLVVPRKQGLLAPANRLGAEYGLEVIDLAKLALAALRRAADTYEVPWQTVLRADSQPAGSRDRANLEQLAREAITPTWTELLATPVPMLLLNAATLARLGLSDLIADVTNVATPRAAARWFLLPRPPSGNTPHLDGQRMPFGPDGWLELRIDTPLVSQDSVAPSSVSAVSSRKASDQ